MGILLKTIFTFALFGLFMVIVLFVDRGDRGSSDARWWRGGQRDLARRLLMHPDGNFRSKTKLALSLFFLVFITLLWTVVP
jgi:hypothetical protein